MATATIITSPLFLDSPTGENRVLGSGEMQGGGGGNGDALRGGPNYWTSVNVFAPAATFVVSGLAQFGAAGATRFSPSGELQVSGSTLHYGPVFVGSFAGAARLISSGELSATGGGAGDATRTQPNFFTATNVFVGPVTISGVTSFGNAGGSKFSASGDLLVSGSTLVVAPIYSGAFGAGAARLVTSGELRPSNSGTVTSIAVGSNLIQQPTPITSSGSIALAPDIAISSLVVTGSTLASGVMVAFSPIYQGSQSGSARYLTSGEIRPDTTGVFSTDSVFWTGTQHVFSASTAVTISGQLLLLSAAYSGAVAGASRLVTSGELRPDTGVVATSSVYWTGAEHVFSSSTAVTISGTTTHLAPVYQGAASTSGRYVVSGELKPPGTGTVTTLVGGSNLVFQPSTITVTGSVGLSPNLAIVSMSATGDVLVSGQSLHFSPIYQQSASGSSRYVTSGELRADTAGVFSTDSVSWTGATHVFSAATAVTFSGSVLALSPIHQGSVSTANRYVTSGELRAAGTGTVTSIVVGSNLQQQPLPLTTSGSIALNPDVAISTLGLTGNLLVSGTALYFAPAWQGSVTTANRYVTSGELKPPGTGTVTSIVVGSNLIQQPTPLTTSGSIALSPDIAVSTMTATGNTLVSGTSLHFAPIFQGSQVGGNRYVLSGELRPDTGVIATNSVYWTGAEQVFSASTAVTISGQALFLAPAYSGSVAGGNRFVTSGELRVDTGVINTASVYWTGAAHVFSASTAVTISGQTLHLSPIYQGSVSGANRYLTSGELKPDTGITSINSQVGTSQTMVTASTGNDFAITSAANVHTFALPDATEFARGVVSTGSQTFSGAKIFADQVGFGAGILVGNESQSFFTGQFVAEHGIFTQAGFPGTSRLLSSGEIPSDATASAHGFVSTDTQTISGAKTFLSPFQLSSTLLVSGTTLAFAPQYQGSIAGGNRYVTSGELQASAGGGDAQRLLPNFFTAANVFVGPVTVSGVTAFGSAGGSRFSMSGDLQVSGTQINYSPQYQGSVAAANRYVTSGELRVDTGVLATDSVYWTGAQHVYSPDTTVTTSGLSRFGSAGNTTISAAGDVQISGVTLSYSTLNQTGGNAYAISGYAQTNVTNLANQVALNPGIVFWKLANFGAYGVDFGYSSASARFRTRLFSASEISLATVPSALATTQANFTDMLIANAAGVRILGDLQASGVSANYGPSRFGTAQNTIISADGSVTVSGQSLFYQHAHFNPQANIVTEGGLQISGASNVTYQPIYNNVVGTSAQRYVVSGEMDGVIARTVGPVMVSGVGIGTLFSATVPANALNLAGQKLIFNAFGHTNNNSGATGTVSFRVMFGAVCLQSGTIGANLNTSLSRSYDVDAQLAYSTSTRQFYSGKFILSGGTTILVASGGVPAVGSAWAGTNVFAGADTTQAQTFAVTVQNTLFGMETFFYGGTLKLA